MNLKYALSDSTSSYATYYKTGAGDSLASMDPGYGHTVSRILLNGQLEVNRADSFIVSGRFSFDIPTDFGDTLHVTDGWFDLKA